MPDVETTGAVDPDALLAGDAEACGSVTFFCFWVCTSAVTDWCDMPTIKQKQVENVLIRLNFIMLYFDKLGYTVLMGSLKLLFSRSNREFRFQRALI